MLADVVRTGKTELRFSGKHTKREGKNDQEKQNLSARLPAIGGTALLSAGIFSGCPTPASAAEWNDIALQAEYSYGETLNVPARTLSAGGQTAKASSVLSYPDGSSTLKTETTLDMTGVYTLAYIAEIGGRIYKTEESFRVYDDMARVGEGLVRIVRAAPALFARRAFGEPCAGGHPPLFAAHRFKRFHKRRSDRGDVRDAEKAGNARF